MRFFKSQRGAELSEIVAGLLVVLVAGVAATSVMFNGLDTAAERKGGHENRSAAPFRVRGERTCISRPTTAAPQSPRPSPIR